MRRLPSLCSAWLPRNREPSDTKGRREMERWRKRENGRVTGRADERNATRKGERMGASEWTDGRARGLDGVRANSLSFYPILESECLAPLTLETGCGGRAPRTTTAQRFPGCYHRPVPYILSLLLSVCRSFPLSPSFSFPITFLALALSDSCLTASASALPSTFFTTLFHPPLRHALTNLSAEPINLRGLPGQGRIATRDFG